MGKVGWIMTALLALFLLGASVAPKLIGACVAVDSLVTLGWSPRYLLVIGFVELACVLLYVVPRTSIVGAVLMTGLLGGAIASHLRADSALFSHTLFGIYLALFMWTALLLRDGDLRACLARSISGRARPGSSHSAAHAAPPGERRVREKEETA